MNIVICHGYHLNTSKQNKIKKYLKIIDPTIKIKVGLIKEKENYFTKGYTISFLFSQKPEDCVLYSFFAFLKKQYKLIPLKMSMQYKYYNHLDLKVIGKFNINNSSQFLWKQQQVTTHLIKILEQK